jgi:hypothetical protein
MKVTFRYSENVSSLSEDIARIVSDNKQLTNKIDDFLLEEAQYYQGNSPVGATGELKGSWDVIPSRKVSSTDNHVIFAIVNDSKRVINRIGGRKPGKMQSLESLKAWALTVLGDADAAYPVARKIAKEGTERYKRGTNWVGIDYRGKIIPNGRIDTFAKRLIEYIKQT